MADVAFIFNPTAQSGATARRWDEIARTAAELEVAFDRIDTLAVGTSDLVEGLVGRYSTLVAIGGDGTVSDVIQGVMQARDKQGIARDALPTLAIVPFGTGNDIAKSFAIPVIGGGTPNALHKAIETVRFGADFRMDLGRVDDRFFADAFSLGLDPRILKERNIERERVRRDPLLRKFLRDYMLYFYVILRFPWLHHNVPATLTLDGRTIEVAKLTNLIINNTKVYAGEFVFNEHSRANDGLLDVVIFRGWRDYLSRFILAARMMPLNERMLNKVLVRQSEFFQARSVSIRLKHALGSQLDGEEYRAGDSFELSCEPDALTLKIPVWGG
jgi:diacylglycerol kinase (ATP)